MIHHFEWRFRLQWFDIINPLDDLIQLEYGISFDHVMLTSDPDPFIPCNKRTRQTSVWQSKFLTPTPFRRLPEIISSYYYYLNHLILTLNFSVQQRINYKYKNIKTICLNPIDDSNPNSNQHGTLGGLRGVIIPKCALSIIQHNLVAIHASSSIRREASKTLIPMVLNRTVCNT